LSNKKLTFKTAIDMEKDKFIELVTKYLSNEANSEEKEQLRILLEDEEYSKLFTWISGIWHDYKNDDEPRFNFETGLEKLTSKIEQHEPGFSWIAEEFSGKKISTKRRKKRFFSVFITVAIIFIFSFVSIYYFALREQPQAVNVFNEKITQPGQKSILTLFDGTKITLNAGSKLRYPTHFGESSREVYLEGEAYFEVVRNTKKPFIVHTGKISTTVLGTKFNVTAYPDMEKIKVSLVEGKVSVSGTNKNKKRFKVNLVPKQQYVFDMKRKSGKVKEFNILKEIGWKDNTFIFDNDPLDTVLRKLGRAFGVKLEVADKNAKDYKLKANFQNESFWTIIETIKYATELDYVIVSKNNELEKVIFKKPGK